MGGNNNDYIPILLHGFFSSPNYSLGARYGIPIYMDTTPGAMRIFPPSTTGNYVRLVGHVDNYNNANSNVVIRFNPDNFWVVI